MTTSTTAPQLVPASDSVIDTIKITTIIFDMDGVLADSEPRWNDIDRELLGAYGIDYAGEHKHHVLGKSFDLSMQFYKQTYDLPHEIDDMNTRRQHIAADYYANHIAPFEDAPRVLQALKELGFRIGLATSSRRNLAESFLSRHELTLFFDTVVTGEDVQNGKPHPDIYLRAAELLGSAPNHCLVVEDSLAGVEAGKSAGMSVAAIPDAQFVNAQDYIGRADWVLSRLGEVVELAARLRL